MKAFISMLAGLVLVGSLMLGIFIFPAVAIVMMIYPVIIISAIITYIYCLIKDNHKDTRLPDEFKEFI